MSGSRGRLCGAPALPVGRDARHIRLCQVMAGFVSYQKMKQRNKQKRVVVEIQREEERQYFGSRDGLQLSRAPSALGVGMYMEEEISLCARGAETGNGNLCKPGDS